MRKIKKINGFLVVKFNDREKREYEGTALGEYGVIDAEVYTGNLDIDRGAMEYDDADTLEVAVELARGLESEEDITDEPPTYTAAVETNESYTEEAVEPAALIEGWTRRLATQVKSKHYPDTDPRTAAHELYGFKMALRQIGFLPESEVITDPDTFGAGRLDGPMPRNPEELLAFVCDERCKNRAGHTQEELDAICAKCPLGQLYEDAEAQDLRIRERSERALREHIEGVRHAEDTVTALLGGHEALAYSKKRKKAQKTQGFITVRRTDMTGEAVKIPKGHVFKSILDINGEELRFFVLEAATLQKGASSVDVLVEAETEGSRYNVPAGQIVRTLTYLGDVTFSNAEDWIVREGSDTEDDESARARTLRSWSELAQRATEDTFIDAAESVPGVLFAQADCNHPRGQGTVDVIVTGTAGEATEGLLAAVREAVDKIAGPYDNILVKSSVTVSQNISVTVTTDTADTDEAVENRVKAILTELLAVRRSRKLNELTLSDINHAIRSGYSGATNAAVSEPEADVKLGKDKVITLGDVSVTVERE